MIGVDLGAQYVKVAAYSSTLLSPTTSTTETKMILNDQTNRKSPSCVALRYVTVGWSVKVNHVKNEENREEEEEEKRKNNNASKVHKEPMSNNFFTLERAFAEPADALLYRFPTQTVCHPLQYLSSSYSSSSMHISLSHNDEREEMAQDCGTSISCTRVGEGSCGCGSRTPDSRYHTTYSANHPHRSSAAIVIPFSPSEYVRGASPSLYEIASSLTSTSPYRSSSSPRAKAKEEEQKKSGTARTERWPTATASPSSRPFAAFSVEELIGMFLREARRLGEQDANTINQVKEEMAIQLMKNKRMKPFLDGWKREKKNNQESIEKNDDYNHHYHNDDDDYDGSEEERESKTHQENSPSPPSPPIRQAVLAIPSGLSVAGRQSLVDAGTLAGFRATRLLHSTTAAVYQLFHLRGEDFIELLKTVTTRRSKLLTGEDQEKQEKRKEDGADGQRWRRKEEEEGEETVVKGGGSADDLPHMNKDGAGSPTVSREKGSSLFQRNIRNNDSLSSRARSGASSFIRNYNRKTSAMEEEEVYLMVFEMGYQWTEASVFAVSAVSSSVKIAADALHRARARRTAGSRPASPTDPVHRGGSHTNDGGKEKEKINMFDADFLRESHTDSASSSSSTSPQVRLRRVSTARSSTLGGQAFDMCIAQYWDKMFFEHRILGNASSSSSRSVGGGAATVEQQKDRLALLRAAEEARERLSVNKVIPVHVERLHPSSSSSSFSTTLSVETFNHQCRHLFEAAVQMAKDVWDTVDELYAPSVSPLRRSSTSSSPEEEKTKEDEENDYPHPRLERLEVVGAAARMPGLMADLSLLPSQLLRRPFPRSRSTTGTESKDGEGGGGRGGDGAAGAAEVQTGSKGERKGGRGSTHDLGKGTGVPVRLRQSLNADEAVVLGAVGFASGGGSSLHNNHNNAETSSFSSFSSSPSWMPGTSWVQDALTNNIYMQVSVPPELRVFKDNQEDENPPIQVEKKKERGKEEGERDHNHHNTNMDRRNETPPSQEPQTVSAALYYYRSPLQLVLEKDYTVLPALYSAVLPEEAITGPFIFSLYSPPSSSFSLTSPAAPPPERQGWHPPSSSAGSFSTTNTRSGGRASFPPPFTPMRSHEEEMSWLSEQLELFYEQATRRAATTARTTTTAPSSSPPILLPPDTFARHYAIRDTHLIRHTIKETLKKEEAAGTNATFHRRLELLPSSMRVVVQVRVKEDGIPEVHQAYMEASWTVSEEVWEPVAAPTATEGGAVKRRKNNANSSLPLYNGEENEEDASSGEPPQEERETFVVKEEEEEEGSGSSPQEGTWRPVTPRMIHRSFPLGMMPVIPSVTTAPPPPSFSSNPNANTFNHHDPLKNASIQELEAAAAAIVGHLGKSTDDSVDGIPRASLAIPALAFSSSGHLSPSLEFTPTSFQSVPVTLILPAGSNLNFPELVLSRTRLDAIDKAEERQRQRTHFRNELETLIIQIRISAVWEKLSERFPSWFATPQDEDDGDDDEEEGKKQKEAVEPGQKEDGAAAQLQWWYNEVERLSEWLENKGEDASLKGLRRRLAKGKALKQAMDSTITALLS